MSEAGRERHYGVIAALPAEAAVKLVEIRRRYLRKRLSEEVHVTVVYPFEWEGTEAELCEKIEEASGDFVEFRATLDGVSAFPHMGVVFLRVEDGGNLKRLHLRLVGKLGLAERADSRYREYERDNYVPHITLAADLEPEEFRQAWWELRECVFGGEFRVKEIGLYREVAERKWEEVKSFAFDAEDN